MPRTGRSRSTRSYYSGRCGTVSKNFRASPKQTGLTLRLEVLSGGASVEVLGPGKVPLYSRYACGSMEERIDCRDLKTFRVRITSENFCGKFDISLE